MRRAPLFIVCSPLPQVGKTLLARLLVAFFHAEDRRVSAFDVNPDDYALAAQLPEITAIANIDDTRGQMALFDHLIVAGETAKVIDLGYRCFDRFFAVMQEIGFAAEARRRWIAPLALFIAEPDQRSTQNFATLQDRFRELPLVPVFVSREGNMARRHRGFHSNTAMVPLQIPYLSAPLKATLQQSSLFSRVGGGAAAYNGAELTEWTRRVFLQFRELELRLLLEELKPALQLRA